MNINGFELKEIIKMVFIYNALEKGWIVKKGKLFNSFEFIKNHSESGVNQSLKKIVNPRRCISEPQIRIFPV